jgi:hypothetical protein
MSSEAIPLNYIPILVFIVIALGFGVVSLLAGWVVRPSRPNRPQLFRKAHQIESPGGPTVCHSDDAGGGAASLKFLH